MQAFDTEVTSHLVDLAPLLLEQLDAMTDRMVDVLSRTEPAYRDLIAGSEEELRRSTRDNLEHGLLALVGAPVADRPALHGAREIGRRRATQGIPLEAVLRAYRLGGQVTWEALLKVSAQAGGRHDTLLLQVAGTVWRTNDGECAALAEGYRDEQRRLAGVDEETRRRVLDGLLDGRGDDPSFVRTAADMLAMSLDGRLMAVVALPTENGEPGLEGVGPELLRHGVRSVWGTRSGAQVGLIALGNLGPAEIRGRLEALTTGPVGVSAPVDGAGAVSSAYRLAETAARTLPRTTRRVVTIDERLPEALLSNSPEISSRLVGQTLGGLLALPADEREVLLDTLAAFLASDGSPTRAADELYCHRNTVMHRLRRIEQVTGRKVADPRARLQWQLALLGAQHGRPTQRSA
ncbi:PucR C-terminal helix-turn-helix domain-containing protein [Blastococcus aurantiacus]|uniref:PucR C-terminal helix-turn-helix domain-containing protein n=1 Tax=Blastococcus aurantiacus TaxID=1550231 RepID=A0A1G7MP86_9ACTN|nr:helix-turn-helix domain-containing protein [Blastococcus aurantiacus]SDF63446.1 PucR C-terminal helix-turn-helix domain-containing protein [Blastococcus aurantiacus]